MRALHSSCRPSSLPPSPQPSFVADFRPGVHQACSLSRTPQHNKDTGQSFHMVQIFIWLHRKSKAHEKCMEIIVKKKKLIWLIYWAWLVWMLEGKQSYKSDFLPAARCFANCGTQVQVPLSKRLTIRGWITRVVRETVCRRWKYSCNPDKSILPATGGNCLGTSRKGSLFQWSP